jgi:hypothetical protein
MSRIRTDSSTIITVATCLAAACGSPGVHHLADSGTDSSSGGMDSSPGSGSAIAAFDLAALPTNAFAYTQGTYIEGFEFTTPNKLRITQLGYFDSNLAGTAQTFTATDVGIYDMTTNALLGSATVEPGDAATGIYRFHALATPIELDTTDTYAAVAVTGSDYYVSGFNYGGQLSSPLTWVGFAGLGNNNLTETSTLVEPNFFWNTTGNLGADFIFEQD